jgi:succinyl-CoA synthetase alpha subunit
MFEDDPETERVVLIGEIGGLMEIAAARFIGTRMTKPVVAYIAGKTAPYSAVMGHAGAVIDDEQTAAGAKIQALRDAGVRIADSPQEIPHLLRWDMA